MLQPKRRVELMKPIERDAIQETLERICEGAYGINDVKALLIGLRPYMSGFETLREAADFVAHNDKRDKGIVAESLRYFLYNMRFFKEYKFPNRRLDPWQPFPAYVKHLMLLQIPKLDPKEILKNVRLKPKALRRRIEEIFIEDRLKQTALVADGIPEQDVLAVCYLLRFLVVEPIFTAERFQKELLACMKHNKIRVDHKQFQREHPGLTLCLMLHMHRTKIDLGDNEKVSCSISYDGGEQSRHVVDGVNIQVYDSGTFSLHGTVTVDVNDGEFSPSVSYPIISSTVKVKELCHESLLVTEDIPDVANWKRQRFQLDQDLKFKAGQLHPIPVE